MNRNGRSESTLAALQASYQAVPKHEPPCAICQRHDFHPLTHVDRHDLGITTAMCRHCGFVTIYPRPVDEWFSEMYRTFYWPVYIGSRFEGEDDMFERDQCVERASQILEGIAPYLPRQPAQMLDIGCGQGGMLVAARDRFPGVVIEGVEPSESGVAYCRSRHGIDLHPGIWDEQTAAAVAGCFDLVSLVHVVEHVLDPVKSLTLAAKKLSDQGCVYVEVPDLMSHRWRGRQFLHIAHVHAFTEYSLTNLCARAGLEPVQWFHGLADLWPWAVGVLGKRRDGGALPAQAVPSAPPELLEQVERHVRERLAAQPDKPSLRWRIGHWLGRGRRRG